MTDFQIVTGIKKYSKKTFKIAIFARVLFKEL